MTPHQPYGQESVAVGTGTDKELGNKTQPSSTSVSKQSGLLITGYFKWQKRK